MNIYNSLGFQFASIKVNQFAILSEDFKSAATLATESNIDFQLYDTDKMVECIFDFVFKVKKEIGLKLNVSCFFKIEDSRWLEFEIEQDMKYQIPKGLLQHWGVLTIGTTRGILHAKTEGSKYHNYIMETINLVDILGEDAVFTKE